MTSDFPSPLAPLTWPTLVYLSPPPLLLADSLFVISESGVNRCLLRLVCTGLSSWYNPRRSCVSWCWMYSLGFTGRLLCLARWDSSPILVYPKFLAFNPSSVISLIEHSGRRWRWREQESGAGIPNHRSFIFCMLRLCLAEACEIVKLPALYILTKQPLCSVTAPAAHLRSKPLQIARCRTVK